VYGHVLRASSCTSKQRANPGVIFKFNVDITSSWWGTRIARGARSSWSRFLSNLILPHFLEFSHLGDFVATRPHCEAFLHTFNMKICTHKTCLEVELLCSCNLTSKVVQCNAMKFTKNLMRCVHLEDTKTLWENCNSPWWNVKGHYVDVHSMSRLMVEPLLFHSS
jgi:hypothetical protein